MKRTTKYVALDVHQATTVAAVREHSGRVIARSTLPTEAGAIVEFFRGMRGSVHVAFEEGTQAQWLHDLLAPVVDQIVVCDRRGEHRGNKADQLDADKLSHRLLTGDLRAVYHGSSDRLTLQELTRTYMNLVEDSTRTMLRLEALFRARAIRAPGTRIYGTKDRGLWLTAVRVSGPRRCTQSSMSCASCDPGPERSWSSRHGVIPRGRFFSRFPSWAPFACHCS